MKRDMELIRRILLAAEEGTHGFVPSNFELQGYPVDVVGYHVYLMGQAGLVEVLVRNADMAKSPFATLRNLTWAGYEFLAASKDPTIWEQARTLISRSGEGSFAIWQSILGDLVKKSIGL